MKHISYIVGVLYGDGCLCKTERIRNKKKKKDYMVRLMCKDYCFAKRFRDCIETITNRRINIKYSKAERITPGGKVYKNKYYYVQIQTKSFYEFIYHFYNRVYDLDKLELLRGLFDSEGCVIEQTGIKRSKKGYNYQRNDFELSISQRDSNYKSIITRKLIKHLLDYFHINYVEGKYAFHIWTRNAIKLHDLLGEFTIKRKEIKYLKCVNKKRRNHETWKEEEINMILDNYENSSIDVLMRKLDRSKSSVKHKIEDLMKQKLLKPRRKKWRSNRCY
jgi:hypothetical protein